MLRYFGAVIGVVIVALFLWGVVGAVVARRAARRTPAPEDAEKAVRLGGHAVRQLDRILTDPTLIGSPAWRDSAQEIVDDWHARR